jgi:ADP-heptose:LPS heptosyltransferase
VKILIIRFSSIGDIVLTSPVARVLQEQKQAEVHFLTKSSFKNLLTANPNISKVWSFEKNLKEVIPGLKKEKFDLVIDLHKNLRSARVKWSLGIPSRSFNKLNFKKWLLVRFKINRLPALHIVDRYLATTMDLGCKNDGKGLDYYFLKKESSLEEEVSAQLPQLDINRDFIAFAIGAAHATKRIPLHRCREIVEKVQLPVVLLGGPGEKQEGATIADGLPHVFNACGSLSIDGSAFLIKKASRVLTPDTGMMHIAAAFQKDMVSVWGNTAPEFGMTPYFDQAVSPAHTLIENKSLSCRPCSKIGYERCPKGHFNCMEQLPYPSIVALLNENRT